MRSHICVCQIGVIGTLHSQPLCACHGWCESMVWWWLYPLDTDLHHTTRNQHGFEVCLPARHALEHVDMHAGLYQAPPVFIVVAAQVAHSRHRLYHRALVLAVCRHALSQRVDCRWAECFSSYR